MNRLALVTGGSRGIGEAIACKLHQDGYRVISSYVANDEKALAFTKETGIPALKFNAADYEETQRALTTIESEWGAIDILVNNAGVTRDAMFHRMNYDAWCDVIQTNLTSCFNTCRTLIPKMRARGFGRVVNIASVNGQAGQLGQANYCAAKAGIIGLSKALALETAASGITVNVVAPGYIDTEMVRSVPGPVMEKILARIPVGRLGQATEVAAAVSYLVRDDAGFATGSTLSINGGQYLL